MHLYLYLYLYTLERIKLITNANRLLLPRIYNGLISTGRLLICIVLYASCQTVLHTASALKETMVKQTQRCVL